MFNSELINQILNELQMFYKEECKDTLDEVENKLTQIFSDVFSEFQKDYYLEAENSVYKRKYYKFSTRVKDDVSLGEKLFRSNDLLDLINKYDLVDYESIKNSSDQIKEYFYNYDDIIGIKIITDLNKDIVKVYKLIKERISELEKSGIRLSELEKQPKTMKNGLEIYKIKGRYNEKFNFELQIKSQLESAWGDMEHQLFYKNYGYTPIKNSAQLIMNQIGTLLYDIDQLLYRVRIAEDDYNNDEMIVKFTHNLFKSYTDPLKNNINIPFNYNLGKLSEFLYDLQEIIFDRKGYEDESLIPDSLIDPAFLNYALTSTENQILNNYSTFKEKTFDVRVFEYILLNWLKMKNIYQENQGSYEACIKRYLEGIYLQYFQKKHDIGEDITYEVINEIMSFSLDEFVYMGSKDFKNIIAYHKLLLDIYNDRYASEDEEQEYHERFKHISIIYGLYKTGNNVQIYWSNVKHLFDEDSIYVNDEFEYMKQILKNSPQTDDSKDKLYKEFISANDKIINILSENGSDR